MPLLNSAAQQACSNTRRRQRYPLRFAWLALLVLLLAACEVPLPGTPPTPTPVPPPLPPPTATPLPKGGNLSIAVAADVPQLKPWAPADRSQELLVELVYEGLTTLGPDLAPGPGLAERWQVSPDGLVLTFTLRSGLTWHDGTPLQAEDAAWTIRSMRELSPTTALLADMGRIIADVAAPNPGTVALTLTERYAPLLAQLATPVLPRHLLLAGGLGSFDFWRTPVGSGPFKVGTHVPGESIVLQSNPRFYRGEPLLANVALVIAPDRQVAAQALADNRVQLAELPFDLAQRLPTASVSTTVSSTATPTATATTSVSATAAVSTTASLSSTAAVSLPLQVGGYTENGFYFLGFNAAEGRLFADGRLRRALSLAVDLPAVVATATGGVGQPISGSAAPGSWADLLPPPTAGAKATEAAALLDEAGWLLPAGGTVREKEGTPLAAAIFVRGDDPRRVAAAEQIAAAGQAIGMNLTVEPADYQSVILGLYGPPFAFDLLLGSWINGAADPAFGDYLVYDPDDFPLFHSSQINQGVQDMRPALRNIVGWRDAAYDNQAQSARQLYDLEERKTTMREAQARLASEQPYLFLWADRIALVANASVETLDGPPMLGTPAYLWNVERWYLRP